MGLQQVVVESDSLVVIQALCEVSTGCNSFMLIIDDIFALCSSFTNVVWSFVKRSGNKLAHELAHFQHWEFGTRMWEDEVPDIVMSLAVADLLI